MAEGISKFELKSEKAPNVARAGTSARPDKDHISTLLLELGQANAIVDLLFDAIIDSRELI